jgi:hypothetical protein
MMIIPWKLIATVFGWEASFDIVAARPTLIVRHPRHRIRFTGADGWRQAVFHSIRTPAALRSRKDISP